MNEFMVMIEVLATGRRVRRPVTEPYGRWVQCSNVTHQAEATRPFSLTRY